MQRHLVEGICHISLQSKGTLQIIALQELQGFKPALVSSVELVEV
jgi:hypothetical protein